MCYRVETGAIVLTLHCFSSLSHVDEYLAIDSGGYLHRYSLRALITEWLYASQIHRDGVRLNKSAGE